MKFGDFLNTLAKKVGKENDPALVAILSSSELANRDIDDDFAKYLDTQLMSLNGAKNNPDVLNHFKPIILKSADDKFSLLAEKYGFGDEIKNEKNTYKKFDLLDSLLSKKIEDLKSQQGKGGNAEKEQQLTAQIQTLQKELSDLTDSQKQEVENLTQSYANEMMEMQVKFALTGKKYANKDLPQEVNILTAQTLLNKAMNESGAVLVNDNGTLKLKRKDTPEIDYLDSGNKPVSFDDFTDKILADNKLLEVSNGGDGNHQQHRQSNPSVIEGNGIDRSAFNEALQSSMEDVK